MLKLIIGLSGLRDDGSSMDAGKDAVADYLVREHRFVRIAFADPIKRIAQQLYGFSESALWGPSELRSLPDQRYPREHGPTTADGRCACCGVMLGYYVSATGLRVCVGKGANPMCYLNARFALQRIGTEFGRTCYESTWADVALEHAKSVLLGIATYHHARGLGPASCSDRLAAGVVIPDVRWPTGNEGTAIKAAGGVLWRVDRPGTSGGAHTAHTSERQIERGKHDSTFDRVLKNDSDLPHLERLVQEALIDDAPVSVKMSRTRPARTP
jgi:hypothetical protein